MKALKLNIQREQKKWTSPLAPPPGPAPIPVPLPPPEETLASGEGIFPDFWVGVHIYLHTCRNVWLSILFLDCIYLFLEREEEGEKGEKHQCERETLIGCLLLAHNWGPGPQLRHVSWLGNKRVTVRFTGRHSSHWAVPARALHIILTMSL